MNLNRTKVLGFLLSTGLTLSWAQAASITAADLPQGTNWYAHVNLELIENTEAGRTLMLETVDEALGEIEQELDVDIRAELEGVTLFGGELPHHGDHTGDGAIILHGIISEHSRGRVLAALERHGAVVNSTGGGGLTFYTVTDDDGKLSYTDDEGNLRELDWHAPEAVHFSFGPTQTLVTQSLEVMQKFVDAGGYLGGFDSGDPGALLVLQADRALVQGGANTVFESGDDWDSSVLRNVDSVALLIAEDGGGLRISAQLSAASAEVAMSVRNIVEGLVALKALDESDSVAGDILRAVRFENDGNVLRMEVPIAADQVAALKDL